MSVTMKDVAEEAGVSVTTVSHIINETRYVSPELTERVNEAIEQLGYHPNKLAQSLKTQKTATIGLIVTDITNQFFSTLVRGVEDISVEHNHNLFVCNSDEDVKKETSYIELLTKRNVDGVVIAPTGKRNNQFKLLKQNDIPFVFVDRKVPNIQPNTVLSQNVEGSYRATELLIQEGLRRIGIVLGIDSVTSSEERLQGYKKALEDYNIDLDSELIRYGNFKQKGGVEATNTLLDLESPPDAIFSVNNKTTLGVLEALKGRGFDISDFYEMPVVTFDDNELLSLFDIPLPTVKQKPYEIGVKATKLLFDDIETESDTVETKTIRIPVELKNRI